MRASKGIHLVVPKDRMQLDTGLILRTEKSVLFVIPWGRHWIVGTTDTDWELDKAHPAASSTDIDYVLEHVNAVLDQPLTREDVEGVYAGLRPLLTGESESTSKLSREHTVAVPVPGLVAVAGGKYTTYRVMARDAIDAVARGLDRTVPPSATHVTPLVGADGFQALWNRRDKVAAEYGVHVARVEHLLRRYGTRIEELLAMVAERPELGKPLAGRGRLSLGRGRATPPRTRARCTSTTCSPAAPASRSRRGTAASRPPSQVARLIADLLGWDETTTDREVELYRARVGPSAARRSSPTTAPPTWNAPAPRTCSRRSKAETHSDQPGD